MNSERALEAARDKLEDGELDEACADLRAFLKQCEVAGGDPLEAEAKELLAECLLERGQNQFYEGDLAVAAAALTEAAEIGGALKDEQLVKDAGNLRRRCAAKQASDLVEDSRFAEAEPLLRRLVAELPVGMESSEHGDDGLNDIARCWLEMARIHLEEGRGREAESAARESLAIYQRSADDYGLGDAHAAIGDCEASRSAIDEALASYRRALEFGSYTAGDKLPRLLVAEGRFDEAIQSVLRVHESLQAQLEEPEGLGYWSGRTLAWLAADLAKSGKHRDCISLLQKTLERMPAEDFPDDRWEAAYRLGRSHEQLDDRVGAIKAYAEAIAAGTQHRQTFSRYLGLLEKQGDLELARETIHAAVKSTNDATLLAELRKRDVRISSRLGLDASAPQAANSSDVVIRSGSASITQFKLRPMAKKSAHWSETIYCSTGGKKNLKAWRVGASVVEEVWARALIKSPTGLVPLPAGVLAYRKDGRVGEGSSSLHFFSKSGSELGVVKLPDVPSDIVCSGDTVYAGCRDGKLYAFDVEGNSLWQYEVERGPPRSEEDEFALYFGPPAPYYVSASREQVAFSSYRDVYCLDPLGNLRWRWAVPQEGPSESRHAFEVPVGEFESVTLEMVTSVSSPSASVDGLFALGERRAVVRSRGTVFELVDGSVARQIDLSDEWVASFAVDETGLVWAFAQGDQVQMVHDGKVKGTFKTPERAQVAVSTSGSLAAAWSGRDLTLATPNCVSLLTAQFPRPISTVEIGAEGGVTVVAAHLYQLRLPT